MTRCHILEVILVMLANEGVWFGDKNGREKWRAVAGDNIRSGVQGRRMNI